MYCLINILFCPENCVIVCHSQIEFPISMLTTYLNLNATYYKSPTDNVFDRTRCIKSVTITA